MEEKKLASQRKKALAASASALTEDADGMQNAQCEHQNVRMGRIGKDNLPLAKPFEDQGSSSRNSGFVATARIASDASSSLDLDPRVVRRGLIQDCMTNSKLTSRERQRKIQELMRMSDMAVLAMINAGGGGDAVGDGDGDADGHDADGDDDGGAGHDQCWWWWW